MKPCIFCGRTDGEPSNEHTIPKWARDSFSIPGPVTFSMRPPGEEMRTLLTRPHLNIVLRGEICRTCNNGWLASLERRVKPLLAPMAQECRRTTLTAEQVKLLSLWAVKTVFLFERAIRQQHPTRPLDGTAGTDAELAWVASQFRCKSVTGAGLLGRR